MKCRRPVAEDIFLKHFWDCFLTFKQSSSEAAGMPAYFRFLTLLSKLVAQKLHRTSVCAESVHEEH